MALEERYPGLALAATLFSSEREIVWKRWETPIETEANLLYLYGFSPSIEPLLDWVSNDPKRRLVIIEDRIEAIRELQKEEVSFLLHEQIHLKFFPLGSSLEEFLSTLVSEFPYGRVEVLFLHDEEEKFHTLKELLLRKSVLEEALFHEMLYYPKLAKNIFRNAPYWEEAFDLGQWKGAFQGVPAIYAGAGPSLQKSLPILRELGDKALLLAGGSAITALGKQGVYPHLTYAFDPNQEEFTRLAFQSCFDAPLIYAGRTAPDIFHGHRGPLGYFVTRTGGGIEEWFEKELGIKNQKVLEELSEEALSVTTIALMTAVYMGCNPIILVGVDLAYDKGKRYAEGIASSLQLALEEKKGHAGEALFIENGITTCTKWLMERDVIDDMARKHRQIEFVRAGEEGLPFRSIPISKDWPSLLTHKGNLRQTIHNQIQETLFDIPQGRISALKEKFRHSLQRCLALTDKILEGGEGGERFELALEEEVAYEIALKVSIYALSCQIKQERAYSEEAFPEIKREIYTRLKSIIEEYLYIC